MESPDDDLDFFLDKTGFSMSIMSWCVSRLVPRRMVFLLLKRRNLGTAKCGTIIEMQSKDSAIRWSVAVIFVVSYGML